MNGDAYKPSGTTWNVASDMRIKENIVDANLFMCYNDLKNLQLRRFNYISSFTDEVQIYDKNITGFIAQEIISTIPKAVRKVSAHGFDDFNSINIDQIVMTSFGALKKTINDKEVLESTIISIQTLNSELLVRLSTIEGVLLNR